jgi:hypothetical protein
MKRTIEGQLCLHGAIVMFTAFVSGMLIGLVAMGQVEGSVDNWKLAHNESLINAIVLFAVAGVIGKLAITEGKARVVSLCLIVMAYCNAVFGFMRGATGAMGYQFDDSLANNIATFAGMLGVPLAVIAFTLILIAAAKTAKSD